jgi:methylenetetrahydrofolate dehydrogenase (NADP+) / methenyltetrahydrofolate cyclohydrolase
MVIDGKAIAEKILSTLKSEVIKLPFTPVFCDVLVGEDPVSKSYVSIKGRTAEQAGFSFLLEQLPSDITEEELVSRINVLNSVPNMCGIIVQLPLPSHLHRQNILNAILPELDVDCLGAVNSQKFYSSNEFVTAPPTALAVMEILEHIPASLQDKKIVIIGKGNLVGRPVCRLLEKQGHVPFMADENTENFKEVIKNADVLICGAGHPKLITGQMVKPGSIVIDAGTSESEGGIVGDVDFESVSKVAGWVSPVPGGVGPVTVAKLLENVLERVKK